MNFIFKPIFSLLILSILSFLVVKGFLIEFFEKYFK